MRWVRFVIAIIALLLIVGVMVPVDRLPMPVQQRLGPYNVIRFVQNLTAGPEVIQITGAVASSELPGHPASHVFEQNNLLTHWSEGVPGPGIGESISVTFDGPATISRIIVYNGASEPNYLNETRPREVEILYLRADGTQTAETIQLRDEPERQEHRLAEGRDAMRMTFTIRSVWQSAGGDNTSITLIELFGKR
jgi:hypothetical protein